MREPGEGNSGIVDGGTVSDGGAGTGGGVIPRGESVRAYCGALPSSLIIGGIGLRGSGAAADRPPDELLPVCVLAE